MLTARVNTSALSSLLTDVQTTAEGMTRQRIRLRHALARLHAHTAATTDTQDLRRIQATIHEAQALLGRS